MTVVSSLLAVIFLIPLLFITQEYKEWESAFKKSWNTSSKSAGFLLGLSLIFPFSKSIVRSTKYSTIAHSSAFVFEIVQATASIGAAIANILIFKEPFTWSIIVSIILMGCAFILYLRGQAIARRTAEETGDMSQSEDNPDKSNPAEISTIAKDTNATKYINNDPSKPSIQLYSADHSFLSPKMSTTSITTITVSTTMVSSMTNNSSSSIFSKIIKRNISSDTTNNNNNFYTNYYQTLLSSPPSATESFSGLTTYNDNNDEQIVNEAT